MMHNIQRLVGTAYDAADVARAIKAYVRDMKAPVVGAHHVTCSDGAEHECADAFHQELVQELLPAYTFLNKAAFRTANLGARYEWNSIRVAESHFAGAAPGHAHKLMVVKINTHVAWDATPDGPVFGRMRRFDSASTYCGALHALLDGKRGPFLDMLREVFESEGIDRLAILRDPERIAPETRSLVAAIVGARLQARQALLDIQDYTPLTPTLYLVLASVSLNRTGRDHELVCGYYHADYRGETPSLEYMGVGDDPRRYIVRASNESIAIEDPESHDTRPAYDYRRIIGERWQGWNSAVTTLEDARDVSRRDVLTRFFQATRASAPEDGALLAFASGLAPIYHVHRAFRISQEASWPGDAAVVVNESIARIREMDDDEVSCVWGALQELVCTKVPARS